MDGSSRHRVLAPTRQPRLDGSSVFVKRSVDPGRPSTNVPGSVGVRVRCGRRRSPGRQPCGQDTGSAVGSTLRRRRRGGGVVRVRVVRLMCVPDRVADEAQSKDHASSPSGGALPPRPSWGSIPEGQHRDAGDVRRDPGRQLVAGAHPGTRSLRQPALSRECRNWQAGAGDVGELTRRTAGAGLVSWPLREADVGQIEQGLERALRTRPVPSSTEARLRFLLAAHRGSTRRMATMLGVSQRTVQRWVTKKPGARRPPGPTQVRAIEEAVLARWQPRIRARRRAQAEAEGFVFHTRARFGFAAPAGSSDDPRVRWITQER
ncbi:telomere-protecting terminal protein Tpg [Streptomyces sp. NPDC002403]